MAGYCRIDELTDDLLRFILSYLISEKEISTAKLVSRRWRHLAPQVYRLRFATYVLKGKPLDLKMENMPAIMARRKEFVTKVVEALRHHRLTAPKLHSLQIYCFLRDEYASIIDEWITIAASMAVEKIGLNFRMALLREGIQFYNFPLHLVSNLEHLYLQACTLKLQPPATNGLVSLKTLCLIGVPLEQSDLDCIVSGCLNLEHWTMRSCNLPHTLSLRGGQLQHLKSLEIYYYGCCSPSLVSNIEIHEAPNLQRFEYEGHVLEFSFSAVPCLEKAHLGMKPRPSTLTSLFDVLPDDVSQLQHLSLRLEAYPDFAIPENVVKFSSLRHMDVSVFGYCRFNILSLTYLLDAAPLLQKLHISIRIQLHLLYSTRPSAFTEYRHLQLKEVELSGFRNSELEVELVNYLLRNAIALERMIISLQERYYNYHKWTQYEEIPCGLTRKDIIDTLGKEIAKSKMGVDLIVR